MYGGMIVGGLNILFFYTLTHCMVFIAEQNYHPHIACPLFRYKNISLSPHVHNTEWRGFVFHGLNLQWLLTQLEILAHQEYRVASSLWEVGRINRYFLHIEQIPEKAFNWILNRSKTAQIYIYILRIYIHFRVNPEWQKALNSCWHHIARTSMSVFHCSPPASQNTDVLWYAYVAPYMNIIFQA